MNPTSIASKVRSFLTSFVQDDDFEDSDNIFELGLVNSLMAMQLVLFLEKEFQCKFSNEELNLRNFRSVDAIVSLLASKAA